MTSILVPADEAERLAQLPTYELFGSEPEPIFDAVAEAAARAYGVSIALVSLVGEHQQWFKARWGMTACSTPRDQSFCNYTIAARAPFLVPDATLDDRFAANPLVVGAPCIRFYAGAPIINDVGVALGALCVIDQRPRHDITLAQLDLLSGLARLIACKFDNRRDPAASKCGERLCADERDGHHYDDRDRPDFLLECCRRRDVRPFLRGSARRKHCLHRSRTFSRRS